MISEESFLIIEDDESWQDQIRKLISKQGVRTLTASEYSDGLNKILRARTFYGTPAILACIVDLRLAGSSIEANFDGLGLLYVCKGRNIPTLVVSGFLTLGLERQLYNEFGVIKCFDKANFSITEFSSKISYILQITEALPSEYRESQVTEFDKRTLIESLKSFHDMLFGYYQEAFSLINEKQQKRVQFTEGADPDGLALWESELKSLDERFKHLAGKFSSINTLQELEAFKMEALKEAIKWKIDFM